MMSTKQTRYFIGYLIGGAAATWHIEVAKTISEKFKTWELYKQIPPHITIFRPFETEDIGSMKQFLKNWVEQKPIPGNIVLSGFDHFEDRVVFAGVNPDPFSQQIVEDLRKALQEMPSMPSEDFPVWHPHATLANHLSEEKIRQIWNYTLTLEKPNFILPFHNITLFRSEGNWTWAVEESFRFGPRKSC